MKAFTPIEVPADPALETLLEHLRRARGLDFTGYKRSSLFRRVHKRMSLLGIGDSEAYLRYALEKPDELGPLCDTILINVTSFFRDPPMWEALSRGALATLLRARAAADSIRVWSAGCASGQEAYTLLMLLGEALGAEALVKRVRLMATDADESALEEARAGSYRDKDLDDVPEPLRAKYFERTGDRFVFRRDLRRLVLFGRHDLVRDAPLSRIDLLCCRNTLMYLNHDAQARVLDRFHFGMADGGVLFLGKVEMLSGSPGLYEAADLRHRIYVKLPSAGSRDKTA